MTPLIPTPVVDKNGRQTTVHKRAGKASSANDLLGSLRPAVGSQQQESGKTVTIKPRKLKEGSTAVAIGTSLGFLNSRGDVHAFCEASGRSAVKMPEDVLYSYLRRGVDVQDAAALSNLGINSVDEIPSETADFCLPGSLTEVVQQNTVYRKKFDTVINRLQHRGVSAVDASKLLSNGLQDAHLDRALNDEQLIKLFSKWSFKSVCGREVHGKIEQDDVIRGFVDGLLPFELIDHKMNELKGIEYELNKLVNEEAYRDDEDKRLREKLKDRKYLVAVAGKAATSVLGYRSLRIMDKLIEDHGMDVLSLDTPQLAGVEMHLGNHESYQIGIEGARYIDAVHRIAFKDSDRAWWMGAERFFSHSGLEVERVYLRHGELMSLRDAGVSAEEAYDLLVKHKLSKDQIIAARESGVTNTLAEGAL